MVVRSRNALLGVLLLLSTSSLLWAQAQVGTIVGRIQVVRGDFPSHPVFVELQLHEATINSLYADNQGRFGFGGLGTNTYHVIIHDDAFYPVDERVDINLSTSAEAMVQIRLLPKEPEKKDPIADRVNGSSPFLVDSKEYRKHFPKTAVKEFDKGVGADKDRKLEEAIRHYEKSVALAPDFYPAHNNLGSDYLSKADFAGAEKEFREVLRVNQSDSQAYFNLANVYILTRRLDEADKALQQGLQKQPDSALGHFLQGSLYARQGKVDAAEAALKRCLELDHGMSKAHLALVNLYLQQQRKSDAITELRTFLKDAPGDPMAPKAREVLAKLGGQ